MSDDIKEILNDIKEIKIGMYTTDEILEFMTDGEGRGFMGRSMYDAIINYITNLQEEIQKKKEYIKYLEDKGTTVKGKVFYGDAREVLQERIDKAILLLKRYGNGTFDEDLLNILQGDNNE